MAGLLSLSVSEDRCPPLNLTPQRQRQKTLETIVAMLLELAELELVLCVLEDLHWTDPSTLELLGLLIEQTPTSRLFVLLTCRPEFESPFGNRSYLTQMTLNRLSQNDIEQMVHRITDDKPIPGEVIQQIVEKTDGVPLFIEEMTKSVLESGLLKEIDDRYELVDAVSSLAVPSTLQDSLMARLDRLVTAKGVAQQAAVIGRQFSYTLLQAMSELDDTVLERELGLLVDAELVYQRGTPPQATYIFKHALVTDTAYESLLRNTRQGYHRRIAQVLAERFPEVTESQPELLAQHYTEAGLNEQAVDYWQQAGEKAVERSANAEAVAHLRKGLELLRLQPETPERDQQELHVQITLGSALTQSTGMGSSDVEGVYLRARELCQQVRDTPQEFSILNRLCNIYNVRGPLQTARELSEQLLHLATRQADAVSLMNSHVSLGSVLHRLGHYLQAREHLERARTFGQFQPSHSQLNAWEGLRHLFIETQMLWELGYPDQGAASIQEALMLAQQLSSPFVSVYTYFMEAVNHYYRGEWHSTRERAETVIALATEHGFAQLVALGHINRGLALTFQGQEEEGIAETHQGLIGIQTVGSDVVRSMFMTRLAAAYHKVEQPDRGLRVVSEAHTLAETTGERNYEAERHRLAGELLLQQSAENASEAESCFHQAINLAQNRSAKSWELRAATSLAKLWQSQSKVAEARDLLAPVYGWFTEGFDTADLIDAKALLDELTEGSP